jgi:hypothetical protein
MKKEKIVTKNSKMKNRKRCKKFKSKRNIRSLYIKIFMYEKEIRNLWNKNNEILNENSLLNIRIRDMDFNTMQLDFKIMQLDFKIDSQKHEIDNQNNKIVTLNQCISLFQILAKKSMANIEIISNGIDWYKQ